MTTIESAATTIREPGAGFEFDEAQLAAVSFLARYSGRTLDAYRHDLRGFFQWATDQGVAALGGVARTSSCSVPGWRTAGSPRRRSTVASRRSVGSTGSRTSTDASDRIRPSTSADRRSTRRTLAGLGRSERGVFLFTAEQYDRDHAALAVLLGLNGLRVSEACATNIEDLGVERGHRTLRILGKGNKPATVPLVPRTARTIDLAVGERHEGPILRRRDGHRLDRRTAHRWVRSIGKRAGLGAVHPHMLRAAFIMAALDAGVPLRDVQIAARHADPRTTTIYDRRRQNFEPPPRRLRRRRLRRRGLTPSRLSAAHR